MSTPLPGQAVPRRNPDGTLTIPRRAETGDSIGDGAVTIGPDDPEFATWLRWLGGPR